MAVAREPNRTTWNQPLKGEEWCHVAIVSPARKGPQFMARSGCLAWSGPGVGASERETGDCGQSASRNYGSIYYDTP
jgi:hypothetical protein